MKTENLCKINIMHDMTAITLRPFSTNSMHVGRKWKSKAYKTWRDTAGLLLKHSDFHIPTGDCVLYIVFYTSNCSSTDLDNLIKPFCDAIQDVRENFNDKRIVEIHAAKRPCSRGAETIMFKFEPFGLEKSLTE